MTRISRAIRGAMIPPALLVLAASALAQERIATLDPDRTVVEFRLGATAHTVEGSARLESAEIRFDLGAGTASGEIVVDATSFDSGNKRRDGNMHEKVLESDRHPRIVFRCESITGELPSSGTGQVTIEGSLEIHGDTHAFTLLVDVAIDGSELQATTTFTVPYVEWGMKDPSRFVLRVKKEVEITIDAAGTLNGSSG